MKQTFIIKTFGGGKYDFHRVACKKLETCMKYLKSWKQQAKQKDYEFLYPDLLADDAIFLLAELYEYYMKDIPQAMEMYKKLLKDHSNSIYAVDARKRFRELRGDEI